MSESNHGNTKNINLKAEDEQVNTILKNKHGIFWSTDENLNFILQTLALGGQQMFSDKFPQKK